MTTLVTSLDEVGAASKRRRLAVAAIAAEIGAIAVSRAVTNADPALANEMLEAARKSIAASCKAEGAGRRR
ncbi:MAG: transcriptional regulator, TetR family [Labilithrix sp.]|nr:transcriptional regulator, TetR family [Labilithrix sp.]